MVGVLIVQLAKQSWGVIARLMQLACVAAQHHPSLLPQLAQAGAVGVVLDTLQQGARHHPAWPLLSTAGAQLLALLVPVDDNGEAAQPQALALLLSMLGSRHTRPPARQAVAATLHAIAIAKTVNREKLLAAGALPVVLRALQRLEVLCDPIALQELLWLVALLTDVEAAPGLGSTLQLPVATCLVPLLFLFSMPYNGHCTHLAALVVRALHVQVAGHDVGKDVLRQAGVLPLLVHLTRRHTAPYSLLREQQRQADAASLADAALCAGPQGASAAAKALRNRLGRMSIPGSSIEVSATRPPEHEGCSIHAPCNGNGRSPSADDPLIDTAEALGTLLDAWTPRQRLLAALLLRSMAPDMERGRRAAPHSAVGDGVAGPSSSVAAQAASAADGDATPSPVASDAGSAADGASPGDQLPQGQGSSAVAEGLALACYSLLLPLLVEVGTPLSRQLCPLRESIATLKTLLCDCPDNQALVVQLGLVPLLVDLVAQGDMGLAWQAAEACVFLCSGEGAATLVAAGGVEEVVLLLEEAAEALHGLTLRKQIRESAAPGAAPVGSYAASAGAGLLAGVHVRPSPLRSSKPARFYLVSRAPLDFTTSACLYASHGAGQYCDYCTPSAAIKVLLRLITNMAGAAARAAPPAGGGGAAAAAGGAAAAPAGAEEVAVRLLEANGLYGVLLLLQHEAAGVHHSKMAGSLLTLLDLVVRHAPSQQAAKDEIRAVGGMGVLVALLGSLLRPGVMDVYQLRVALCHTLQLMLEGNAANKLLAREHSALPLLVSLLAGVAQHRRDAAAGRAGELVLDDSGPLAAAALRVLAAAAARNYGSQEQLLQLGLMHLCAELLRDGNVLEEVRVAAAEAVAVLADGLAAGQDAAVALGVVPLLVGMLLLDLGRNGRVVRTAARGLRYVLAGNGKACAAAAAAGAVQALLRLLPGPRGSLPVSSGRGAAVEAEAATSLAAEAAAALEQLAGGSVELQNDIASKGALQAVSELLSPGRGAGVLEGAGGASAPSGAAPLAALQLLVALVRQNTFVKNCARSAGLPSLLVAIVRRCGLVEPATATAAAAALAELVWSNHANQEAVADEGGLEVAIDISREAVALLAPLQQPQEVAVPNPLPHQFSKGSMDSYHYGGSHTPAFCGEPSPPASASGFDASQAGGGGYVSYGGYSGYPGAYDAPARTYSVDSLPPTVSQAQPQAAYPRPQQQDVAALVPALQVPPSLVAATATLLQALLRLLGCLVELNQNNKNLARELGGLSLLSDLVMMVSSPALLAFIGAPPLPLPATAASWASANDPQATPLSPAEAARLQHACAQQAAVAAVALARCMLSHAVAAACGAVAQLCDDSVVNQQRLLEQAGLPVGLMRLVAVEDAPASCAAALALEWVALRSDLVLETSGASGTAGSSAPWARPAFELQLLDVLAQALYLLPVAAAASWVHAVKAATAAAAATAGAAAAAVGVTLAHDASGRVQLVARSSTTQSVASSISLTTMVTAGPAVAVGEPPAGAFGLAAAGAGRWREDGGGGPWTTEVAALLAAAAGPLGPASAAVRDAAALLGAIADVAEAAEQAPLAGAGAAGGAQPQQLAAAAAADHADGLVLSSALAGPTSGPTAQAVWSELAGRCAPSFRHVSSVLQEQAEALGMSQGPALDRRRQLAWMTYLLACRSPEHRQHIRKLVRTSLTPLAKQIQNAEACRTQLDDTSQDGASAAALAAAAAALATGRPMSLHYSPPPPPPSPLQGFSSIGGVLPVSTSALEDVSVAVAPSQSLLVTSPQHPDALRPAAAAALRPGGVPNNAGSVHGSPSVRSGTESVGSTPAAAPPAATPPKATAARPSPFDTVAASALPASAASPANSAAPSAAAASATSTPAGASQFTTPAQQLLYGTRLDSSLRVGTGSGLNSAANSISFNTSGGSGGTGSLLAAASGGNLPWGRQGSGVGTPSHSQRPSHSALPFGHQARTSSGRLSVTGAVAAAFNPGYSPSGGSRPTSRPASPPSARARLVSEGGISRSSSAGTGALAGADRNRSGQLLGDVVGPAPPSAAGGFGGLGRVGSSGVGSDDEELMMIQQEVALLAHTRSGRLNSGSQQPVLRAVAAHPAGTGMGAVGLGTGSARNSPAAQSPAASPMRWNASAGM